MNGVSVLTAHAAAAAEWVVVEHEEAQRLLLAAGFLTSSDLELIRHLVELRQIFSASGLADRREEWRTQKVDSTEARVHKVFQFHPNQVLMALLFVRESLLQAGSAAGQQHDVVSSPREKFPAAPTLPEGDEGPTTPSLDVLARLRSLGDDLHGKIGQRNLFFAEIPTGQGKTTIAALIAALSYKIYLPEKIFLNSVILVPTKELRFDGLAEMKTFFELAGIDAKEVTDEDVPGSNTGGVQKVFSKPAVVYYLTDQTLMSLRLMHSLGVDVSSVAPWMERAAVGGFSAQQAAAKRETFTQFIVDEADAMVLDQLGIGMRSQREYRHSKELQALALNVAVLCVQPKLERGDPRATDATLSRLSYAHPMTFDASFVWRKDEMCKSPKNLRKAIFGDSRTGRVFGRWALGKGTTAALEGASTPPEKCWGNMVRAVVERYSNDQAGFCTRVNGRAGAASRRVWGSDEEDIALQNSCQVEKVEELLKKILRRYLHATGRAGEDEEVVSGPEDWYLALRHVLGRELLHQLVLDSEAAISAELAARWWREQDHIHPDVFYHCVGGVVAMQMHVSWEEEGGAGAVASSSLYEAAPRTPRGSPDHALWARLLETQMEFIFADLKSALDLKNEEDYLISFHGVRACPVVAYGLDVGEDVLDLDDNLEDVVVGPFSKAVSGIPQREFGRLDVGKFATAWYENWRGVQTMFTPIAVSGGSLGRQAAEIA